MIILALGLPALAIRHATDIQLVHVTQLVMDIQHVPVIQHVMGM